jgi:DNA repair protein RadC
MSGHLRIKDMPDSEKPRERLVALGADALKTEELIAILLRTGLKGQSAIDVGRALIARFETLDRLSRATLDELCQVKGIGRDKAVGLVAAISLARRMAQEIVKELPLVDTPERVAELLREENRQYQAEQFQILLLNTRRRLLRLERLSQGTQDTILVRTAEVFRSAILANAAAIVVVHNHPSGDPTPSEADIKVTRDLIRAGQLLKIDVLDHVILGRRTEERIKDYASLKELGYFYS